MSDENSLFNKFKAGLEQGLVSSKKIMNSAAEKSRKLEEYSVLKLDIKRLEKRNSELFQELGINVFTVLAEEGRQTVSVKTPVLSEMIIELERNREMLFEKEKKLGLNDKEDV